MASKDYNWQFWYFDRISYYDNIDYKKHIDNSGKNKIYIGVTYYLNGKSVPTIYEFNFDSKGPLSSCRNFELQ